MSIPSAKYLKVKAANRLKTGKEPQKVVLIYAAILAAAALAGNLAGYLLGGQTSQAVGLQGMNTRAVLSTAKVVVTIAQLLLVEGLALGYCAAMLRIARGQYASGSTLKAGLERLWLLVRTRLLEGVILTAMSFALCMVVVNIYLLTPFSNRLVLSKMPLVEAGELTTEAMLSLWSTAYQVLLPVTVLYVVALIPLLWYFSAVYRLVDYLLIEKPQLGALGALQESRRRMRGSMRMLLRVDLSFWWYYLLQAATKVLYPGLILAALGVTLSVSPTVFLVAALVIYLAADFAVRYFFSNRVAVTYALFYDSLCPKEAETGAVLGNIFQM